MTERVVMIRYFGIRRLNIIFVSILPPVNTTTFRLPRKRAKLKRRAKHIPDNIVIKARWADGKAVESATVKCYPVGWYSYTVQKQPVFTTEIVKKGEVKFPTKEVFSREKEFGVKYSNCLVEVEAEGKKGYAWIPLYYLQNCWFDGKDSCELEITLKRDIKLTRDI